MWLDISQYFISPIKGLVCYWSGIGGALRQRATIPIRLARQMVRATKYGNKILTRGVKEGCQELLVQVVIDRNYERVVGSNHLHTLVEYANMINFSSVI